MPKKVLIFSLAYYPHVGGAEVAIKEITDRISDIEWHMITLRFSANDAVEEKIGNILVHRVGSGNSYLQKILFVPRAAALARRLHRTHSFDGMWAMMSYMLLPIVRAHLGMPYALTLQEGDTEQHMFARARILPFLPLLKKGFREARVVSAISTYLAQWAKKYGFAGGVEVIPNGVDAQQFAGASEPHQGTVLFTSSRLVHKNALDDVIRALPALPGVHFSIAGIGPEEAALKRLAASLEVSERVHFLGFVPHEKLPAHLHASDIFIRPSRTEGMGNSFIEAMAAGVPVIATTEGGLSDFISSDVAWPIDKDRPDQIAAQVKNIVENPGQVAEVIERARVMAVQKYDWDLIARDMREKVFARLFA